MLSKDIIIKLISNYDNYDNIYIGIYKNNDDEFSIMYSASELIKMANKLNLKEKIKIQNLNKAIKIVENKLNIKIIEIN